MKHRILALVCSIATAFTASAQVPSLINYQGRLTDSNGAPVTGNKNFAISIYDAATGGNLLYEETIGAVTLDANGVYSFQFGSAGSSNTQVTETIGTTAGSTLTYTKTLTNTPVVNNSITVTDGTNSWSQSVGNPGVGATATANTIVGFVIGATITNGGSGYTSEPAVTITGSGTGATATATVTDGVVTAINIVSAGSGYTGGATITIDQPVIPLRVDYSGGAITATYSSAPASGMTITATYRYGTNGITGALSSAAEQWIGMSVAGALQGSRHRLLATPFALEAKALQKSTKRKVLAAWSLRDAAAGTTAATLYKIILNQANQGQSKALFREVDPSIKEITRISTFVAIQNEPAGGASLELIRVDSNGNEETVLNLVRNNSSGSMMSDKRIPLDWDQYEYYFKLYYSGWYDGERGRFGSALLKPVVIDYIQ
jgi:hypothetical protein